MKIRLVDDADKSILIGDALNPFFKHIQTFYERQHLLEVHLISMQYSEKFASVGSAFRFYDLEGRMIVTSSNIDLNRHEHLKEQFYLSTLALTLENFETFLKNTIHEIVNLMTNGITTKPKDFIPKSQTNSDRVGIIKNCSKTLKEQYTKKELLIIHQDFILLDSIRHLIIHSNAKSTKEKFKDYTANQSFKSYFNFDDDYYLHITSEKSRLLMDRISTFTYIIFESISLDNKFEISTSSLNPLINSDSRTH